MIFRQHLPGFTVSGRYAQSKHKKNVCRNHSRVMAFLVPSSGEGGAGGKYAICRIKAPHTPGCGLIPMGEGPLQWLGLRGSMNSGHCGKCRWEGSCEICREGWEDRMVAPGSQKFENWEERGITVMRSQEGKGLGSEDQVCRLLAG